MTGKVIPASFLKIGGRSSGKRLQKGGWLVVLVGDQNPSPEAPPQEGAREEEAKEMSEEDRWRRVGLSQQPPQGGGAVPGPVWFG